MEIGETSDNNKEVSKVNVSIVKGKITCPLCNDFFKEATTICECLHNFCKTCIHDKIINENLKCCPVCKVDLGTNPLNKLRKDNSLQSITDKVSLLIIDAKKSKNQLQSSQASVVINKASNLQYQRKEKKQTSSLVDNLPNASTHNVNITTKKRSTPRRIRKTTTPLKLPTITEPSQTIDQSCIKKSTSSIPSSKNVSNDNDKEVSKQETNVKEEHKVTGSLVRRLYDLNKLPSIMEEDEDTIMDDITISNDDNPIPLKKNNSNFENKTKDDKASTKKISASKQIVEKPNFVEKTMEVKLPLNIDLNKLPSTFYIGESSNTCNNPIANASSHLYKNNENTSDAKGEEMKEIIYIDDDDDDNDCILLGWFNNKEQPNLQLSSKIDVNEICDGPKDCNKKGKGKIVNFVDEDDDEQPLSVISSKLVKKARGKRQKKVVQPREVKQPKFVQPNDIVVDVTTTRAQGTTMMPIWFALVSSKDKEKDKQLPQISPKHFRITEENVPISSIKTYIAGKVGLADASEVEIMLRGHPVVSSLSLHSVLDIWCQTATTTSRTIQTTIGSSADDFVMILTYARKIASP